MLNNKLQVKQTNNNQRLPYRKPKVYHLGSIDKVQGGPRGRYREPNGYYNG